MREGNLGWRVTVDPEGDIDLNDALCTYDLMGLW